MLNVRFYQTADPEGGEEPFPMPQQQVTSMLGTIYQGARLCCWIQGGGRRLWDALVGYYSSSAAVQSMKGPWHGHCVPTDLHCTAHLHSCCLFLMVPCLHIQHQGTQYLHADSRHHPASLLCN